MARMMLLGIAYSIATFGFTIFIKGISISNIVGVINDKIIFGKRCKHIAKWRPRLRT